MAFNKCLNLFTIGEKTKQISSWGMVQTYEFGYLVENQRLLSKDELIYISSLWDELVEENMPLRAVISNRLVSVPAEFYDSLILGCFIGNVTKENIWVSEVMSLTLGIACGFVEQRIWEMGKQGIITLVQDGENMSDRIWRKS